MVEATMTRGAREWTNWGLTPPPSLRDYALGGRYYDAVPEMVHATTRARRANGGEGSSGAGGGEPALVFPRNYEEQAQVTASAVAKSEAELADELEAERREMACAIAEVEAFKAREAEQRATEAAKSAAVIVIDYADE